MFIKAAICALLLAVLVAAGCGDGDDEGEAAAPTKSEFIAEANRICAEGNAEVEAAFADFDRPPTPAEAEAVITETILPSIQQQVDEISALTPPEGDEEIIEGIAEDTQAVLDRLGADPALLFESESRGEDPFAQVNERLADYGIRECSGDPKQSDR